VPIAEIPGLLAVSRDGDVWVRRADGSELRQLSDDPNLDERPLTWLTDGSQLVITRTPNNDPYASSTLELIDPVSGQLTELGTVTLVYSVPTWSPDGTRIAFGGDGGPTSPGIAILDLNDGSLTRLTNDGGHGTDAVSGPIWSPDGSLIAYQAWDNLSNDVKVVSVTDGAVTSPAPDPSDDYPLRWVAVDGTLKLVFGSFRGTEENKFDARPWIVNVDGSDLQLLDGSGIVTSAEPQPQRYPSPDGRWVAVSCDAGVCIENEEGDMPLHAVPNTEGWDLFSLRVSWTPGGDYLAYSAISAERDAVILVPLPDGDPVTITPDGISESAPAWQPITD
jgi:Tol biopolymer transport system component